MGRVYIVGHSGREITIDEWIAMWKRLDEHKAKKEKCGTDQQDPPKKVRQSLFDGDPKAG